jgi:hypothetical protein
MMMVFVRVNIMTMFMMMIMKIMMMLLMILIKFCAHDFPLYTSLYLRRSILMAINIHDYR